MKPLDLTQGPPRIPRAELGGVIFLPRTIDKFRATLPGGNLGAYAIAGFSQMLLDELEIEAADFTAAVAAADSDAAIETFVRERAKPAKIEAWNRFVSQRQPRGGNRAEALETYAWLHARPDLILALDVLEEDDKQHFARA
ncbi:MAG: hypothetical protein NVSMB64_12330 [Candidatus Velthaea sp.]